MLSTSVLRFLFVLKDVKLTVYYAIQRCRRRGKQMNLAFVCYFNTPANFHLVLKFSGNN